VECTLAKQALLPLCAGPKVTAPKLTRSARKPVGVRAAAPMPARAATRLFIWSERLKVSYTMGRSPSRADGIHIGIRHKARAPTLQSVQQVIGRQFKQRSFNFIAEYRHVIR